MSLLSQIILIYLLIINLVTFIYYGVDKYKAKKGKWRVSEATLLVLALFGGAIGAFFGMRIFRHKTRHWKFKILVPLLSILWIAAVIYLSKN